MDYIFRQHYNAVSATTPVILLAEPEPEALALYARHLTNADLLVNVCMELHQLLQQVRQVRPHLLIINPAPDITATILLLRQVLSLYPDLPIITVGAPVPDPYLDRLMAAGVALHINRSLSQPRDIAIAARQMLGLG